MLFRRVVRPAVVVIVAGGLGLSACGQGEAPAPAQTAAPTENLPPATDPSAAPVAYDCQGGRKVQAVYVGQSSVELTRDGQKIVLAVAPSGSGARYAGHGMEWRMATRGDRETATLTRLENDGQPGPILEQCARPAPAPVAPAPCAAGQTQLTLDGGDAGMGHRISVLAVTNRGPGACLLSGYPTVAVLDAKGAPLANVVVEHKVQTYLGGQSPAPVAVPLAVGGKAVFDFAWTVVPHEGEGETVCPSASTVRLTLPGDGRTRDLAQSFTPCGGRVEVSPFRAPDAVAAN